MTSFQNHKFIYLAFAWGFLLGCDSKSSDSSKSLPSTDSSNLTSKLSDYENGKETYRFNCSACHSMPTDIIDGPSLFDNLFERLPQPSQQYFIGFVKDTKGLENQGDTYINHMKKVYSINIDHNFKDSLSDQEIQNILLYVMVSNKINKKK